jgi:hypothetical protein
LLLIQITAFREISNLFVRCTGSVSPFARNRDSNLLDTKTEEKRIVVVTSMVNKSSLINSCGPDISVGIVTGYGLDGPEFESR